MVAAIEDTCLWRSSLGAKQNSPHDNHRDRLKTELLTFRSRITPIAAKIASDLPGLTVHDVSHLDRLWEAASLVAGEGYPLNPMEAFVLGGAILLHDSGLCTEAYEGGSEALYATSVWKDALAAEKDLRPHSSEDDKRSVATFVALRHLHAKQAEALLGRSWRDPNTGDDNYLIQDVSLRKHLGQMIGRIAHSHHWNIEDIPTRLGTQFNALGEYPASWRVHPVKLACLLRCADAIHIDQSRAPDFLHALLHRQGISFAHWHAQNWMGRADLDTSDRDGETILFTSTRDFGEHDSDAWWIAFDAIDTANKEIHGCNKLLASQANSEAPPFKIKRIRGAGQPSLLEKHVRTRDWHPSSAMVHVGNVERVVRTLGGSQLYSDVANHLGIVLREIIQNARDAVVARREMETEFQGRIVVRLGRDNSRWMVTIEDDGVGMSERVLLGPLIDFGNSLWSSSLVQTEFPGLRSSEFRAVGRYGIGFFSAFMVADRVIVSSRRFEEGLAQTRQLVFDGGLKLRPVLKVGKLSEHGPQVSTRIVLSLKDGHLNDDASVTMNAGYTLGAERGGPQKYQVPFANYLSAITVGLDVDITLTGNDGVRQEIHRKQPVSEVEREDWLRRISFLESRNAFHLSTFVRAVSRRLRPIMDGGKCYGLAAIVGVADGRNLLGRSTVGGLLGNPHQGAHDFVGFLDFEPRSVLRHPDQRLSAPDSAVKTWAMEQRLLLEAGDLTEEERLLIGSSLVRFGIDPLNIVLVRKQIGNSPAEIVTIQALVSVAQRHEIAIPMSIRGGRMESMPFRGGRSGLTWILAGGHGEFVDLSLVDGIPKFHYSLSGCLHRAMIACGVRPLWRIERDIGQNDLGPVDALIVSALSPAEGST
jgi:hypothetical protein